MTADVYEMAGPVEEEGGKLVLRIPLFQGGYEFKQVTEGISEIDGSYLKITLPQWLVKQLDLRAGSRVVIDNKDHKFNMVRVQR
jgi:hypothetical protein